MLLLWASHPRAQRRNTHNFECRAAGQNTKYENERERKREKSEKIYSYSLHYYYYHFENPTKFESSTLRLMVRPAYVPWLCAYEHVLWVMMISIELSLWCPYVNICRTEPCARASTIDRGRQWQLGRKCAESRWYCFKAEARTTPNSMEKARFFTRFAHLAVVCGLRVSLKIDWCYLLTSVWSIIMFHDLRASRLSLWFDYFIIESNMRSSFKAKQTDSVMCRCAYWAPRHASISNNILFRFWEIRFFSKYFIGQQSTHSKWKRIIIIHLMVSGRCFESVFRSSSVFFFFSTSTPHHTATATVHTPSYCGALSQESSLSVQRFTRNSYIYRISMSHRDGTRNDQPTQLW